MGIIYFKRSKNFFMYVLVLVKCDLHSVLVFYSCCNKLP